MASIVFKFFFLVVFLGLVSQGDAARCHIKVFQKKTGNWAHGMPEWKVVVTHNCLCAVSQVKLNCNDFQTYLAVDPSILTVSDGVCLIKNGEPISFSETVHFFYAWDPQFPFHPLSFHSMCD